MKSFRYNTQMLLVSFNNVQKFFFFFFIPSLGEINVHLNRHSDQNGYRRHLMGFLVFVVTIAYAS